MTALHLSPISHWSHSTASPLGVESEGKANNRPYAGFMRQVRDPFVGTDLQQRVNSTRAKEDVERVGPAATSQCCVTELAVHIWATKPNLLLLTKSASDPADVHSSRATLYIAERKARVFCEDRRVTMEFIYPKDMKCVVKHVTGTATPTVAVHAADVADHRRRPPDDSGHFTVRKLPNGVVLRDPVRCKHSTWATILFSCKDREQADVVFTSLEALRVRRLNQPLSHPSMPEIQVVDNAVILQHRAREHLAKRGVRPEGVLAPLTPPPSIGATSHPSRSKDDGRAKRFIQLPDVNVSPREFEELMSSSSEEETSSSDDHGSSSDNDEDDDDITGERKNDSRSQLLRKVFLEPFVPVKQELANARLLLGVPVSDTTMSRQDSSTAPKMLTSASSAGPLTTKGSAPQGGESAPVAASGIDDVSTPQIKSPAQPPSILKKVSIRFPEDREDISQSYGRSPEDEESYEVLLGSPRDPTPSGQPFHSAAYQGAMVDALREKAETERRTAELIEKLRADLLLAAVAQASRNPITFSGTSATTATLDPASVRPTLPQPPNAAATHRVTAARAKTASTHDPYDSDSSVEFHVEGDTKSTAADGTPAASLATVGSVSSTPALPMPPQPKQPPKIPPRRVSSSGSLPQSRVVPTVVSTGSASVDEPLRGTADQPTSTRSATLVRSPVKRDELLTAPQERTLEAVPLAPTAAREGDDAARRRSNVTPVASSRFAPPPEGGERNASSPYPHRGSSASRRQSSTSPARQRSTSAGDGSRRCRWCRNVAPESHDDRCAFRKIKCKKCNEVVLLKDRQSHQC